MRRFWFDSRLGNACAASGRTLGLWLRRLQAGSLWKRWKPLYRDREIEIRAMRREEAPRREALFGIKASPGAGKTGGVLEPHPPLIALRGVRIVGSIRVFPGAVEDAWKVASVYVDPWSRSRGLGLRLVEAAVGVARRSGARRVYAHVRRGNISALRVFARGGFRVLTGRIRDGDGCQGEDFVTVLRELDGEKAVPLEFRVEDVC